MKKLLPWCSRIIYGVNLVSRGSVYNNNQQAREAAEGGLRRGARQPVVGERFAKQVHHDLVEKSIRGSTASVRTRSS